MKIVPQTVKKYTFRLAKQILEAAC
eukprot:SAG31_NODE_42589_length_271_cov_0.563953_1_plen_24_part_01